MAGSILQTLMGFPTLESFILELSRMLPILLLFLALLPVFSKFVSGGSSFSWALFLIFIIDGVLLIVYTIQISYIFWRLFQKWKELSDK